MPRFRKRYSVYILSLIGFVICLISFLSFQTWPWGLGLLIFSALAALGTRDVLQRARTLSRNYPILAHIRYGLEYIGPEIRQYFIQSDLEERPFSREQRTLVYQRAKSVTDSQPFGSLMQTREPGYQWMNHSVKPTQILDSDFRVLVGGQRAKPYSASVFNISAMSFGSLSANAISALNKGAKRGGFYHDTGEGAISPYHLHGGDLVWEIGSGYFGCRDAEGKFDPEKFRANAIRDEVKMIEIKLSQGAKPGHGGVLPGAKVNAEIAATRGVPEGQTVISPASHSAFNTPREMITFIQQLRELSGGKPVGIKMALGHPWEWFAMVKAMLATGDHPDFIVVDGAEGGTGAAPVEFINHIGIPLFDAQVLVHNTLVGAGLRDKICIGASGRIISAFGMARSLALGADWCNSARGFMFSLGCIQAKSCHTDRCPSGVATQDKWRGSRLDVPLKSERVHRYHANTLRALTEMLESAGLEHPDELGPEHIIHRIATNKVSSLARLYTFLEPNVLLEGGASQHAVFREYWAQANPDTFAPPAELLKRRESRIITV